MITLIRDFGESMPNATTVHPDDWNKKNGQQRRRPLIFLHSGLFSSKASLFRDMVDLNLVSSQVSESTLHKWWMKEFWNVKIKHWQPFAKCELCIVFKARLLSSPTEALRDICRLEQGAHRDQVRLNVVSSPTVVTRFHLKQISIGRRRYDLRETYSELHPDLFLHISIDAMDNKKTNVPQTRHMTHTKKVAQEGELLKSRVMGRC